MLSQIRHAAKVVHGLIREHVVKNNLRSPHWPSVRRQYLLANPACAACGSTLLIQVHHREPFHLEPHLELDPTNLISLCQHKLHHLLIGHGDNFKAYNPHVQEHADQFRANPADSKRIYAEAMAGRRFTE